MDHQASQGQQKLNRASVFSRIKTLLFVFGFLGMGVVNVATLLSDTAHKVGFSILDSVLHSTLPAEVAARLHANAPVVTRRADLAVATKALNAEKTALELSNRALADKHAALELDHGNLKKKSAKQAEVASRISKRIAGRVATSATRSASSLTGRVLPVLGGVLTVAMTGLEIHEICETLQNLNELNSAFELPLENQQAVCGIKIPSKEKVLADAAANWQAAYLTTATSINQAGFALVSTSPPNLSWGEAKQSLCPLIGNKYPICQ